MICFYVSLSVVLVVLVVVSVLSLRVLRRLRLDVSRLGKTVEAQKKPETLVYQRSSLSSSSSIVRSWIARWNESMGYGRTITSLRTAPPRKN